MTAKVPPFGWRFFQDGLEEPLTGANPEDLLKQVITYRASHNIPLGDPAQEIEDQICTKYPANCNPPSPADVAKPTFIPKTLHDRVVQWAANRYERASSISYVSQEEAEKRAAICRGCPNNELHWKKVHCAPCVEDVEQTLKLVGQLHFVNERSTLGACTVAGHDNNVASFLPEKFLRHRKQYPDLPGFCWMTKLPNE